MDIETLAHGIFRNQVESLAREHVHVSHTSDIAEREFMDLVHSNLERLSTLERDRLEKGLAYEAKVSILTTARDYAKKLAA